MVALAVGLVLSTSLLGGGWLWSTWRERETRIREARASLTRVASGVRAAVDESLEELRAREDQRPFYLYSHFYSPPDVLAISDPVAVSPLATPSTDPRIVGHFQIHPSGRVSTPYAAPDVPVTHLAVDLPTRLSDEAFAPLRAMVEGAGTEGAEAPPSVPSAATTGSLLNLSVGDATNETPPTADLNEWGNVQAQDIAMAQAGDVRANQRVMDRGRQVPRMVRREVSWDEAQPQNRARRQEASPTRPRRPSATVIRSRLESRRGGVLACGAPGVVVRLRVRGSDGALVGITAEGTDTATQRCIRAALRSTRFPAFAAQTLLVGYRYGADASQPRFSDPSGLDNMVQRETEVEYTPMAFARYGEDIALRRIVSHEQITVAQGVFLDRERLANEWIPRLVARHAPGETSPDVVLSGEGQCAARYPASAILDVADLCFGEAALQAPVADLDTELAWQVAALAMLLAIALLAAFAMVNAVRRAEALSRQKSAFVSAVSHELRTPLTTVRMHAEMLEEDLVDEARRPKVHRELVRESVRLARLVDNVLSLSKLEEGRRRLRPSEGDLRAHVLDVVEGQRRFIEERGFALRLPEGPPVDALFDRQAVEQIVVNLIDNAVKYGEGEVNEIEVSVGPGPTIRVSDRGKGIPEAEREKVFERFHRVEREETAHAPGTGIGLALVAELAEAHGGHARVDAREGGGLVVLVSLG